MRVYRESIEMNRALARIVQQIERNDRDLSRQLRRAASSVSLNIAEGCGNAGGNREVRFRTALGSVREVEACLDVAAAWGYIGEAEVATPAIVGRVIGMLVNLLRSRMH
jgi:four helix bundle protein